MSNENIKANILIKCEFINFMKETFMRSYKTKNIAQFRSSYLKDFSNLSLEKVLNEKTACYLKGSGFISLKLNKFEIRIN